MRVHVLHLFHLAVCLSLGETLGFGNSKGGRQKTAARRPAAKQVKTDAKNVVLQKKNGAANEKKYHFQKRVSKPRMARIRNDFLVSKVVEGVGNLQVLSGSQVDAPAEDPPAEPRRKERQRKLQFQFQRRLFAARVQYDQEATKIAKDKRRALFHRRLLEAQLRMNSVAAKRTDDKRRAVFHQQLLEARLRNDSAANQRQKEKIASDRGAAKNALSGTQVKMDENESAKLRGQDERRAQFQRKLLEARIDYDSAAKQKGIERRKLQFHRQLLEARNGYDVASKRTNVGDRSSQVKEDTQERRNLEFQRRLLEARIGYDHAVKEDAKERRKLHFQRQLLEARIRYDEDSTRVNVRESLQVLQVEDDTEKQFERAGQETSRKSSIGLQVTDKYLATMGQGTAKPMSIGLTGQYLTAIQAISTQTENIGLTNQYLAAMHVGTASVDPRIETDETRSEAERETVRRQAEEESLDPLLSEEGVVHSVPAPGQPAISLVGRVLLGKFEINHKLNDDVSGKCDLYIAHHLADRAKRHPLIVKLVSSDYYMAMDQIRLEYRIYRDLFARLPTEAEKRLFVRPFDWIDPSQETGGKTGFVMECGNNNLRGDIWENGAYTGDHLRSAMKNLIQIVHTLHKHEVVWTELKAENLIVFGNGDIKGVDLESIAAHKETLRMYTAETYPPEFPADVLYEGLPDRPLDYSYDIWGLGMTLFELATGQPFYTLERTYDVEYIKSRLKDPQGISSEVYSRLWNIDEGARNVILQCLTIDPNLRRSCDDLLKDPYFAISQSESYSGKLGYTARTDGARQHV